MCYKTKKWLVTIVIIVTLVPLLTASAYGLTFYWPRWCAEGTDVVLNTGDADKTLYEIYKGTITAEGESIFFVCGNPGTNNKITTPGVASTKYTLSSNTSDGQESFDKKGKREIIARVNTDLDDYVYCDWDSCDYDSIEYKSCCLNDDSCDYNNYLAGYPDDCDPSVAYLNETGFDSASHCVAATWVPQQIRGKRISWVGDRYIDCVDPNTEPIVGDNCESMVEGETWICETMEEPYATTSDPWPCTRPPEVITPIEYTVSSGDTIEVARNKGLLSFASDPDKDSLEAFLDPDFPIPADCGTLTLDTNGSFEYVAPIVDDPESCAFNFFVSDGIATNEDGKDAPPAYVIFYVIVDN